VTSNDCNQRLATLCEPCRRILSRVRCIAWFGVSSLRPPLGLLHAHLFARRCCISPAVLRLRSPQQVAHSASAQP
jgi:hypothetical protein